MWLIGVLITACSCILMNLLYLPKLLLLCTHAVGGILFICSCIQSISYSWTFLASICPSTRFWTQTIIYKWCLYAPKTSSTIMLARCFIGLWVRLPSGICHQSVTLLYTKVSLFGLIHGVLPIFSQVPVLFNQDPDSSFPWQTQGPGCPKLLW